MELKKAKENLERGCRDYIYIFSQKQGLEFDHWQGQIVTTVAIFNKGKYFFSFIDIMFDLEFNIKEGMIKDYFKSCIEDKKVMSYYTYLKNVNYIRPNNKPDGDSLLQVPGGRGGDGGKTQHAGGEVPVMADREVPGKDIQKSKNN